LDELSSKIRATWALYSRHVYLY